MNIDVIPDLNHELVTLRKLTQADAADWYAYLRLPQTYQNTSWNLQSQQDLQPLIAMYESETPDSPIRFAITTRDTDTLIGTIGLHTLSMSNRSAELAFDLSPTYWGRGIMPAACEAMKYWAHYQQRLIRLQATALESNRQSLRVLEKCGFQREGLLQRYRLVRGTCGNFWMYSHIHPDFR